MTTTQASVLVVDDNPENLNMHLIGSTGEEIPGTLYAKVVEVLPERSTDFSVRFTSMSPQIETFLYSLLGQCTPGSSE